MTTTVLKERRQSSGERESFPSEWDWLNIGDAFDVQQGKALSPDARRGISPRPFLRTANVFWGRLNLAKLDQMDFTEEEAAKLSLRRGDLLVCEGGEIGRTAIWNQEVANCLYQNHIHRLRTKISSIVPEFVMYWMQAGFLQLNLYSGVGNKTTIPNLSGTRLKQLRIPQPPLPEQRSIAAVLSKIRAAVEAQDKIVAALKELKAATMAKLFREGLHGEKRKQTEIGEMPESWGVTTLGNLCRPPQGAIQTGPFGSQLHASDYVAEGTPIVNPTHMKDGQIQQGNIPKISPRDAERLIKHKLRLGDILFSRRGDVGLHAHVSKIDEGCLCGTGCLIVRPDSSAVDPLYLHYFLSTENSRSFLETHAVGSIMPNINTKILSVVPIALPPLNVQRDIAKLLQTVEKRIEAALTTVALLRYLFSSMLHLLMTGQVRVNGTGIDL